MVSIKTDTKWYTVGLYSECKQMYVFVCFCQITSCRSIFRP